MRTGRIIGFVAVALFIGRALWIWVGARAQERTLPDGSRVVLRRVTYGMSHRYATGSFWQQAASRILPARYARGLPSLKYSYTNDGPTMIVWFEHLRPATNRNIQYGGHPKFSDPPDWQGLCDDSGTDFEAYHPAFFRSTARSVVQGYIFHALPTTSRELHFRFVCSEAVSGWQDRTIFTFHNPAFHLETQKWSSYPLTAQQDKLTLVLKEFHPEPRRKDLPKRMKLSFDLFEGGQPANDWELHSLTALDRNGAVYRPYTSGWGHSENHTGADFVGGLSTNAPWKLRFELKHATFGSNELCIIRGLPLGDQIQAETNVMSIPIQGTTLVVRRNVGTASLTALISPPDGNYFLNFVDVLAANGHPFDRKKTYYSGQTDSSYSMGFPAGVTNADLAFGVTRKVFIEVVAQPTPHP